MSVERPGSHEAWNPQVYFRGQSARIGNLDFEYHSLKCWDVFNLGGDNKIDIIIGSYKPNVKCDQSSTPGPPWNSTVSIFANMRASKQFRVFGKPGGEDVQEPLPLILEASKKSTARVTTPKSKEQHN